jgi:hypothetical protein
MLKHNLSEHTLSALYSTALYTNQMSRAQQLGPLAMHRIRKGIAEG